MNTTVDSAKESSARGPVRLWVACAVLTAVTLVVLPIFAWFGYLASGSAGVCAAAVAAVVCWFGAIIALVLTGAPAKPGQAVGRLLAGIGFRTGLPLVVGAVLHRHGGPLSDAGVFGMIVGFYLITLFVETWLTLRLIPSSKKSPARPLAGDRG